MLRPISYQLAGPWLFRRNSIARVGPKHRVETVPRRSALRSHRPQHPSSPGGLPFLVQFNWGFRQATGGNSTSSTRCLAVYPSRGHSSEVPLLLSSPACEQVILFQAGLINSGDSTQAPHIRSWLSAFPWSRSCTGRLPADHRLYDFGCAQSVSSATWGFSPGAGSLPDDCSPT